MMTHDNHLIIKACFFLPNHRSFILISTSEGSPRLIISNLLLNCFIKKSGLVLVFIFISVLNH